MTLHGKADAIPGKRVCSLMQTSLLCMCAKGDTICNLMQHAHGAYTCTIIMGCPSLRFYNPVTLVLSISSHRRNFA